MQAMALLPASPFLVLRLHVHYVALTSPFLSSFNSCILWS